MTARRYCIPLAPLALVTGCAAPDVVGGWTLDGFEIDGDDQELDGEAYQVEGALEVDVLDAAVFTLARRETVDGFVYLYSVAWTGDADDDGGGDFEFKLDSEDVNAKLELRCTLEDADTLACEGERIQPRRSVDWDLVLVREVDDAEE